MLGILILFGIKWSVVVFSDVAVSHNVLEERASELAHTVTSQPEPQLVLTISAP